ncbi:unnamed protein product [marine sediment metagenome]|uniref:Terminase small subunit n=1 Tax=marine sediment metagenome TaxID=412755 RepID=X1FBF6_9ZZZZ
MYQRDAYVDAGYSNNSTMAVIDAHASRLANNGKILSRLEELKQATEDTTIADVKERKQRLTEIVRATIPDFVDGDSIIVEKNSPNVGAVSEITTHTRVFRKGGEPIVITNLKLHSLIQAIAELNKMERVYESEGTTNITNKILNINVISESARKATERIVEGERTE